MTATSGKQLAVGLRFGMAYLLNADGTPLGDVATATNGTDGTEFQGPKVFTLNVPEPRKITHIGEDRVLAVDYLPPSDGMDGELAVSPSELDIVALLGGLTVATVGEGVLAALASSQQGFEPQVGLMLYQQSLDVSLGTRRWRSFWFPSCRCIYMPAGMGQDTQDIRYKIAPAVVSSLPWGTALNETDNGCLTMQGVEMMSEGRPNMCWWEGDGAETEFLLPLDKPATSTAKMNAFSDGVDATAALASTAVDKITYTVAPADGVIVTLLYEY